LCRLLFWQPPAAGKLLLQQFLRLGMASALEQGAHRGVVDRLRASLAAGETIEVAGYEIGPALAAGIDRATLDPPAGEGLLLWREVAGQSSTELAPAGHGARERWARSGWQVHAAVRTGPSFWQTIEIECAPALVETSLPDLGAIA
jgi:hypothetical protein